MTVPLPPELVDALARARSVVALTGAGVSAESGVATFRDAMDGLWATFDPETLATPEAFARDPETVCRWYDERRVKVAACRPNAGHLALADLARALAARGGALSLFTQNVDGLHQAAGSAEVLELHGSLRVWRCARCGESREERGGPFSEHPPRCRCGGPRRPAVVWFGESLPPEALEAAERASGACDLFLSLGTSAVVHPAAGLVRVAIDAGAKAAEVNLERTPISDLVDWSIRGRTGEVLPRLVAAAFSPAGRTGTSA